MTTKQEPQWQDLAAVPTERGFKHKGLYRYDFNKNLCNKYENFTKPLPADFDKYNDYVNMKASFDIDSKTLYYFNTGKMAQLQITDKEWNVHVTKTFN